jgi:hypothetical protein
MNEQIKYLAIKAGASQYVDSKMLNTDDIDLELFAELLMDSVYDTIITEARIAQSKNNHKVERAYCDLVAILRGTE